MTQESPRPPAPPQLYTGALHRYPGLNPSWGAAAKARAVLDLDLCRRICPDVPVVGETEEDPTADIEDFWESVAKMAAAVRACDNHGLPVAISPAAAEWDHDSWSRRLGPIHVSEGNHTVDEFSMHPAVVQYGGRSRTLAVFFDELTPADMPGFPDVADALSRVASDGFAHAVVKISLVKSGIACVRVCDNDGGVLPHDALIRSLHDAFYSTGDDWALIRHSDKPVLIVQPYLPLTHEYRFFVVDGVVVTGAGCVEELTPYDATARFDSPGRPWFDPRTREHRGALGGGPSPVESNPEIVSAFLCSATSIASEFPGTYVLDVAMSGSEVVVVELNPVCNAGLYACDVDAVFDALVQAEDRGYAPYERRGAMLRAILGPHKGQGRVGRNGLHA